ncbi:Endonuclease/Exonuclease/phosphatase family protein [Aphelenchoides avenae]|nr:Endonuclease/Exonuclease/phosphatase family protein [Aphelenchus avenae]
MAFFLRIATLNCWALPQPWPIGSKHRKFRIEKLIEALEESEYDIVTLQEIWSENDFLRMCNALADKYPHAHYFHSGFTGSGTCILSQFPIVSTLLHRYSLNGFAHHVHRGDWFGGKIAGLAELDVKGLRVSVYTTHLHAEYNRENDLYLPHRISQAFELAQFIRHTCRGVDFVILTGDFNMEPQDIGCHIVRNLGNLYDAWDNRPNPNDTCSGMTCDRPDNCYTDRSLLKKSPEGKRLDYILYQSGKVCIELTECRNCFDQIPASKAINYSDHLGVCATFRVSEENATPPSHCLPQISLDKEYLEKSLKILEEGEVRVLWDRRLFLALCIALSAVVLLTINLEAAYPYLTILIVALRFMSTLLIGFSLWHGFVGLTIEMKALKETKTSMMEMLRSL